MEEYINITFTLISVNAVLMPDLFKLIYRFSIVYLLSHVWFFCDPMDCSLPGSSVHEIPQARILEWVAIFLFQRFSIIPIKIPAEDSLGGLVVKNTSANAVGTGSIPGPWGSHIPRGN